MDCKVKLSGSWQRNLADLGPTYKYDWLFQIVRKKLKEGINICLQKGTQGSHVAHSSSSTARTEACRSGARACAAVLHAHLWVAYPWHQSTVLLVVPNGEKCGIKSQSL